MLKLVNAPSAGALWPCRRFRFYAKKNTRNVCIYAKKCAPLYTERWGAVSHLKLKLLNIMTKENYMYFVGALVRHHRKLNGVSLAELSEKSGVHIARLSGIENGKENPTIATMKHIADALELPLNTFFEF